MKLAKIRTADNRPAIAVIEDDGARILPLEHAPGILTLADLLHSGTPRQTAAMLLAKADDAPVTEFKFLAPVDQQEVWAAGVTYKRSQIARMEESESAASHYDKVYSADRPEIFFKATPSRVVHPGEPIRVRYDSSWSVPEPELALVINPRMEIVGYTIGNDVSARDIEGENPLYLPQAKVYRQCCALGPVVLLAKDPLPLEETKIRLRIERQGTSLFEGETDLSMMNRQFPDLVNWLSREDTFPEGVILLTGTGIVPDDSISLEQDDQVEIEITGIGVLRNPVIKETSR